jgi:hypothetical protein
MDVRLPDGTVLTNVPDGTTQTQLLQKLKANGYNITPLIKTPEVQGGADPLDGMSRTEKFFAGTGKAISDVASGLKQRLDDGAAALESTFSNGTTARDIQAAGQREIAETKKRDQPLMKDGWGLAGNITGQAAAGTLAAPLGPLGAGVAQGFAQPTTEGVGEVLTNMGMGGAAGWAGDKLVRGASRVVQPHVRPEVSALMREGVTPTPGQILGGNAARIEAKATSMPFVGDAIASSQRRAGEELNRAAFNRALAPVGAKLPSSISLGREAVAYVDDTLGARYNALLPRLTVKADRQFAQEVSSLQNMVNTGAIDPSAANTFNRILQNDVLGKFQGQNAITGQTMKAIESDLGAHIRRLAGSSDSDQRLLGDALKEAQETLRGLVQRSNPAHAKELKAINTGWANFKRVQRAAGYVGADDGVFTPANLQSAVKALDRSKDHGKFARGKALMQDLSDNAKSVMGSKYPDSGTAGRLMNVGAAATAVHTPAIPLGLLAASGLYTAPAQRALAAALTKRPGWAPLAAEEIESLAPLMGLLGSSAALSQR